MMIDGERISGREVKRLIDLFDHDCREAAGIFFDQCRRGLIGDGGRSEKFRTFWTEVGLRCGRDAQECYVAVSYQQFAEDIRRAWAGLLARSDVRERDKRDMHRALIIQQMVGQDSQHAPLQINRDSQAFAGDAFENKQTAINCGNQPEKPAVDHVLRKLLRSTSLH